MTTFTVNNKEYSHRELNTMYDFFTQVQWYVIDQALDCYIGEGMCDHEGYVLHNKYGTFKIVNREGFSRANFNLVREWDY